MTTPVYSRPEYNRFLGNDDTYEVHDLWNETPTCRIDEIFSPCTLLSSRTTA
jgi:hypothetical protein